MAKTVRKVKRGKVKELKEPPAIVVTPPDYENRDMKVKAPRGHFEDKRINVTINNTIATDNTDPSTSNQNVTANERKMADFSVNQLIAELSENSQASKDEIENIQRKLLQQANEILKVNAFVNTQTVPAPRIIDSTQKYSTNTPIYGRIPVIVPRTQKLSNQANQNKSEIPSMLPANTLRDNQLSDTQLVPERLQETPGQFLVNKTGAMINSSQGNMQRAAMTADEGRGVFFYETGSAPSYASASARAAPTRGECLNVPFLFEIRISFFNRFGLSVNAGLLFVFGQSRAVVSSFSRVPVWGSVTRGPGIIIMSQCCVVCA